MRRSALRDFFALVLPVSAPLLLAPACCPNEIDSVPLVLDGGIPDSATGDMGCAQFCYDTLGPPSTVKLHRCDEFVNSDGNGVVTCYVDRLQCGGRAPEGYDPEACSASVGGWLSSVARLEAASVEAFEHLAGELRAHGAPSRLVEASLRAADDERRHASLMMRLSVTRGGGTPETFAAGARRVRSLTAIATENAREGCVRETWGALLNAWQARHSTDSEIRNVLGVIAKDEFAHAELAWELDEWFTSVLTKRARAEVRRARRRASTDVVAAASYRFHPAVESVLGMPSPEQALAMAHAARQTLWT